MDFGTDDVRIKGLRPLLPPVILLEELPISSAEAAFVRERRRAIGEVIVGRDPRLLVVVGPCSIHDPPAALEYASRLRSAADRYAEDLLIVMRTYFEKRAPPWAGRA
jgi:3-deoxy-7-phosphoheptulonate synthase